LLNGMAGGIFEYVAAKQAAGFKKEKQKTS
jgi:hypothetical protein